MVVLLVMAVILPVPVLPESVVEWSVRARKLSVESGVVDVASFIFSGVIVSVIVRVIEIICPSTPFHSYYGVSRPNSEWTCTMEV